MGTLITSCATCDNTNQCKRAVGCNNSDIIKSSAFD